MKVVGGSFGVKGRAKFNANKLIIEGAQRGAYSPAQVRDVSASIVKEKRFGMAGFLVGSLIFSVIFTPFLGFFGPLLAIVLSYAGSNYAQKINVVEVQLVGDKAATLECSNSEVQRLIRFAACATSAQ